MTFYNTSFQTTQEQDILLVREVDNSLSTVISSSNLNREDFVEWYAPYISNNTNDKIFILSWRDVEENVTTYNIALEKQASDYAKIQSTWEYNEGVWWLRSPKDEPQWIAITDSYGYTYLNNPPSVIGVVPALKISI